MTHLIESIFKEELTQQGLADLRERFPADLVFDMADDGQFKQARKIRTERNKLNEAIDRRRKDITSEIKQHGDSLINQVTEIFDVVVAPFEVEDARRKKEADRLKAIKEERINESRRQLAGINGFISQCFGKDSSYISDVIESVDLIDVSSFHKEVVHEAIEVKRNTLAQLTQMLSDTKARELLAEEQRKMAEERRKIEAQKAEFEAWKRQQEMQADAPKEEVNTEPQAAGVVRQEKAPVRKFSAIELNAMMRLVEMVEQQHKAYASNLRELVEELKASNYRSAA